MSYCTVPPPSYSQGESSKRFDHLGKLQPRQKYVVPRYPKNKPFCPPMIHLEVNTFNPEEHLSLVEVEDQSGKTEYKTLNIDHSTSASRDTEQTIENENLENDNSASRKSISDEQTSSLEWGYNHCSTYSYDQEGFFVSNNEENFAVVEENIPPAHASDEESQPAECGHIGEVENGMEHERNEREKKIKCIKSLCSLIIFVFIFIVFMWLKF